MSMHQTSQHCKNVDYLLIYKFKGNPIKIPTQLLMELNKLILNSAWKNRVLQIAKTILKRTNVGPICHEQIARLIKLVIVIVHIITRIDK